jgi:hypothetical protein
MISQGTRRGVLGFLDKKMLFIQVLRGEVVRDDLSLFTPNGVHLLKGDVVALGQKPTDIAGWTVRIDCPLLV